VTSFIAAHKNAEETITHYLGDDDDNDGDDGDKEMM
jgi:hypothetical protein